MVGWRKWTTALQVTQMDGGIQLLIAEKTIEPAKIVVAKRRRGRRIGTGLAIGALIVGAAVIASESARADRRRSRRRASRHRRNCNRWIRQCNRGNDRSCWRFDNNRC